MSCLPIPEQPQSLHPVSLLDHPSAHSTECDIQAAGVGTFCEDTSSIGARLHLVTILTPPPVLPLCSSWPMRAQLQGPLICNHVAFRVDASAAKVMAARGRMGGFHKVVLCTLHFPNPKVSLRVRTRFCSLIEGVFWSPQNLL